MAPAGAGPPARGDWRIPVAAPARLCDECERPSSGLAILTGLAGRALPGRWASLAAAGVMTGVPLVAAGITLSAQGVAAVEWLASWWLAAASLVVAGLYLRMAIRERRQRRALLAVLAAVSLAGGMSLAGVYALGMHLGRPWLDTSTMVHTHAVLNAVGFAVPALVFWKLRSSTRGHP